MMAKRREVILALAIILCTSVGVFLISSDALSEIPEHNPEGTFCMCHGLHGGDANRLLNETTTEALCLSCHGPAGSSVLRAGVHDNSTAQYGAFDFTCHDCHSSHLHQVNWQSGTNLKMVGRDRNDWPYASYVGLNTVINTPLNGLANVVFESRGTDAGGTFYNSFADDDDDSDGVYDGICEVCHTNTSYHRNDSSEDHSHNVGTTCTDCHEHDNAFEGAGGACTSCHNKVVGKDGDIFRKITGTGGDFEKSSRHVFGATVSNWDCIVCHGEGDITSSDATAVTTTNQHWDSGKTIAIRNVDSVGNPGTVNDNFWQWPKPSAVLNDTDHSNMDAFCMACHDSDGASGISVNITNSGMDTTAPTARRLTPFNPYDCLDGASSTSCGSTPYLGDAYERTRVLDVKSQFDLSNPSHHAVIGQRYGIKNGTDYFCDAAPDKAANTQIECEELVPAGVWNTTLPDGPYCILNAVSYPDQTTCEAFGTGRDSQWIFIGWGEGAWADRTLKNKTSLKSKRETATLHCADCHDVDINSHASDADTPYMINGSSLNDHCWKCHASTTYSDTNTTGGSRVNHANVDANVWGSNGLNGGSRLDPTAAAGTFEGQCLNCHGGADYDGYGAIHGIPSGTDSRVSQKRYRFLGGSYMTYGWAGGDFVNSGVSATCYFDSSSATQPWSMCAKHSGTAGGDSSLYFRQTSY